MVAGTSDIKLYSRLSPIRAGLDWLFHWGAIVTIFVVVHNYPSLPAYIVGMFLIAGLQHGLINLQHDAWHMLCFKKRWLNDFVGAWFYGYPVGLPYFHERFRHLDHHKYFNTEKDPERVSYENNNRRTSSQIIQFYIGRFLGTLLIDTLVPILVHRKSRISPVEKVSKTSLLSEYACVATVQCVLLGSFALTGRFWEYFVLWFIPLVTISAFFVQLRAFLEHASLDDQAPNEGRLRDFNSPLLERFFVSPADFNYHAVHHAYPTVPHFRLKDAHAFLNQNNIAYTNSQVTSYLKFLLDHMHELDAKVAAAQKCSES